MQKYKYQVSTTQTTLKVDGFVNILYINLTRIILFYSSKAYERTEGGGCPSVNRFTKYCSALV